MSPALSGLDMTSMFSEKGTLMSKEQQAEFRAKRKVQKLAGRDLKNTIYCISIKIKEMVLVFSNCTIDMC